MKKIYIIFIAITFFITSGNSEEVKCQTVLEKTNPACSKVLKGTGNAISGVFKGMKKFSEKHQTIGQSLGMKKKDGVEAKKSLKEFSKEHKTINDTIKVIKKKK